MHWSLLLPPIFTRMQKIGMVLVVCYTCNNFDSRWVRKQWHVINQLWEPSVVAPFIPIIMIYFFHYLRHQMYLHAKLSSHVVFPSFVSTCFAFLVPLSLFIFLCRFMFVYCSSCRDWDGYEELHDVLVCVAYRSICQSTGQIRAAAGKTLATVALVSNNNNKIQVLTPKFFLKIILARV